MCFGPILIIVGLVFVVLYILEKVFIKKIALYNQTLVLTITFIIACIVTWIIMVRFSVCPFIY